MPKYYIHDDGKRSGALDKEQLKALKIAKDTPIWYELLEDWTTAGEVEDLKDILENIPPPFNPLKIEKDYEDNGFIKITSVKRNIAIIIFIIVAVAIVMINYKPTAALAVNQNSQDNSSQQEIPTKVYIPKQNKKSAGQLREELLKNEQIKPLDYLSINASEKQNEVQTRNGTFFRSSQHKIDGYIIEGFIVNSATLAKYKDIVFRVNYISGTGTTISSEDYTVYDVVIANEAIEFKQKVYPPLATSSFSYEIVNSSIF